MPYIYENLDHTVTPIDTGYGCCLYAKNTGLEARTNMNIFRNTTLSSATNRAHVATALNSTSVPSIYKISSSNYILNPNYPALEPSPDKYDNGLFGRRFGVYMREKDTISASRLNNIELLRCYSIPTELMILNLDIPYYTEWLDNIM